jgi:hypothetical protein
MTLQKRRQSIQHDSVRNWKPSGRVPSFCTENENSREKLRVPIIDDDTTFCQLLAETLEEKD